MDIDLNVLAVAHPYYSDNGNMLTLRPISTTIIVLIRFIERLNCSYWERNMCLTL